MTAEQMLRRLLILNDYGISVEHHSNGPKPNQGFEFLSDDWIKVWFAPDTIQPYIWEEFEKAGV